MGTIGAPVPRAGLSRAAVVALAVELVDATPDGFSRLTLAAVAARAGVAVPSLYKHVGSLGELQRAVALVGADELLRRSTAATVGRSGPDALRALGHAIRQFAHDRPGLYAASQTATPARDSDPESLEVERRSGEIVATVAATLRGFGVPDERLIDAVRAARAALHGFVDLEAAGGFGMPDSVDASFDYLLELMIAGLRVHAAVPSA